jgi:hypothetical protein
MGGHIPDTYMYLAEFVELPKDSLKSPYRASQVVTVSDKAHQAQY